MHPLALARVAFLTLSLASLEDARASTSDEESTDATVIAAHNMLLHDGAQALEAGRIDLGIRLTLEGLKLSASPRDAAAGHANLCAGYAQLARWDEALAHCNTSITLDRENWRAFNNRAAVFSARGLFDEAITDLQTGLKLAPHSAVLQKSLKITYENRKIQHRHNRAAARA
jgi:tetratricopeptide (TPR) repeat protein